MACLVFEIKHGLTVGKGSDAETHYEVELRELTSADVIDAQIASERVVVIDKKAHAYTSDVLMGLELLRRQIKRIGEIPGPLDMKLLRKLHPDDMNLINDKADVMDQMLMGVEERGRSDAAGRDVVSGTAESE